MHHPMENLHPGPYRGLCNWGGVNSKIYRRNPLNNRKNFSGDNFFWRPPPPSPKNFRSVYHFRGRKKFFGHTTNFSNIIQINIASRSSNCSVCSILYDCWYHEFLNYRPPYFKNRPLSILHQFTDHFKKTWGVSHPQHPLSRYAPVCISKKLVKILK